MAEMTGKLLAVNGYMSAELQEYPVPHPADDALVIKTNAVAICGSDKRLSELDNPNMIAGVIGHEFVGTIVEMGKDANKTIRCMNGNLAVGDRIVIYPHLACGNCPICNRYGNGISACENDYFYGHRVIGDPREWPHFKGGFGEYVYIYAGTYVWKVPDDMPSEISALLDPMAVAVRAVENVMTSTGGLAEGLSTTSTCLVIGAGPIGIMTGMYLKSMGVHKLIMSDFMDQKLATAKEIAGADIVLNMAGLSTEEQIAKVMDVTDGYGADIVISCANAAPAALGGLKMVRMLGHYVEVGFMGKGAKDIPLNFHDLAFGRGVHISSVQGHLATTYDRAFNYLMRYKELPFEKYITHRFYDLGEFMTYVKKMTQPDYLKAVLIFDKPED